MCPGMCVMVDSLACPVGSFTIFCLSMVDSNMSNHAILLVFEDHTSFTDIVKLKLNVQMGRKHRLECGGAVKRCAVQSNHFGSGERDGCKLLNIRSCSR